MNIELKLWEAISLILTFAGFVFAAFKILLTQIDKRLSERFNALERDAEGWRSLEREVLNLKADLPLNYVRKEDYVRGQTIIEAKLDKVYSEIKYALLKGKNYEC